MAIELCVEAMVGVAGQSGQVIAESLLYRRPRIVERGSTTELADDALWFAVRRGLPGLSDEEARAVWLVDVCGLTYADVGRAMRRSPRVVARRIASARRKLERAVATAPDDPIV